LPRQNTAYIKEWLSAAPMKQIRFIGKRSKCHLSQGGVWVAKRWCCRDHINERNDAKQSRS